MAALSKVLHSSARDFDLLRKIFVLFALFGGSVLPVVAAPQWCGGTVTNLWVDFSGNVLVIPSWRGNHIRLCNINQSIAGETTTTCLSWMSLVRSAVQRSRAMIIYYDNAPACGEIPTYGAAPVPGYVMLND